MLKSRPIFNIVIIMLAGVFTALLSYNREWLGDDLCFMFETLPLDVEDSIENQHLIESFGDVVESQYQFYLTANGRTSVQFMTQVFAGLLGQGVFAVCNGVMMVLFIWLLVSFTLRLPCDRGLWKRSINVSSWNYLVSLIALFFLFPRLDSVIIWAPLSFALNYLWVGVMFLAYMMLFVRSRRKSAWVLLLALLLGWSNEAFTIPLSGTLFFYWIKNKGAVRPSQRLMIIALWVGTALSVLSPGTLLRATVMAEGRNASSFITGLAECYMDVKFFWVCVAYMLLVLVFGSRRRFRVVVRRNGWLILMLGIGVLFSIPAHTYSNSLICVELISFIILLRELRLFVHERVKGDVLPVRLNNALLAGFICLFAVVETCLVVYTAHGREVVREALARYRTSPDGVAFYTPAKWPRFLAPYQEVYFSWILPNHYTANKIAAINGCTDCAPVFLSHADYTALIERPDSLFIRGRKVPGSAGAFELEDFYVLPQADTARNLPAVYMAYFDGEDFMETLSAPRRIVYKVFLNGRKQPKELESDTIRTRHGRYILLHKILSTPSRIERE